MKCLNLRVVLRTARVLLSVLLVQTAAGFLFSHRAEAASYNFATIVDSSQVTTQSSFASNPAIAASGDVFYLQFTNQNSEAIVRGSGTPNSRTTIVDTSGEFGALDKLQSVNAAGDIVFLGGTANVGLGFFQSTNGGFNFIAAESKSFVLKDDAWINNNGVVAFSAGNNPLNGANGGIFSSLAPANSLVESGPGGQLGSFGWQNTTSGTSLAINNSGTISFEGVINDGAAIMTVNIDGTLKIIVDGNNSPTPQLLIPTDINDSGTVAFLGFNPTTQIGGLYTVHSGVFSLIADTTAYVPDGSGRFALNNHDEVVFGAQIQGSKLAGIFTGPDPAADKVIVQGDPLDGSTVIGLSFFRGLNDASQIAFWASLADGRTGIFRADPIPVSEPSSMVLAGLGAGLILLTVWRKRRA